MKFKFFVICLSLILIFSGCTTQNSKYEQIDGKEESILQSQVQNSSAPDEFSETSSQAEPSETSSQIESFETSSQAGPSEESLQAESSKASSQAQESEFEETDSNPAESFVSKLSAANNTDSIIAVSASGVYAKVSYHEKRSGKWTCTLIADGFVGYNGVGKAREGSQTTPEGVFKAGRAFGVSSSPSSAVPYIQVDSSHYWVYDVNSPYYNQFVSANDVQHSWNSAEHLIAYPLAYAYCLDMGYNPNCIPGEGSAMFLHCSLGVPTAGCIAISQADMVFILRNINENTIFVVANEEDIMNY